MRIATFNLESFGDDACGGVTLSERIGALRPQIERLGADILCLQEVNGQHTPGRPERTLAALDALLEGTPYASFARASTQGPSGKGVADIHNLVTLSRWPLGPVRLLRHDRVPPLAHHLLTGEPKLAEPTRVAFERPVLQVEVEIAPGRRCHVFNVHLRAPLASPIPGQKMSAFVWNSVAGWAEGYFLSAWKRSAQALEVRLAVDAILDADPAANIVVAGDFNAEDHETPMKLLIGAEEDTGNGHLASRALVVLDRALASDRRYSILHHGRPQMLDHILISRGLLGGYRGIDVHNEALADEAVAYGRHAAGPGSYHAPVVAEFQLQAI